MTAKPNFNNFLNLICRKKQSFYLIQKMTSCNLPLDANILEFIFV